MGTNSFVTYVHMKPDLTPFYVGKGTNKRAHTLNAKGRNAWHGRVVNKYGRRNIVIEVIECQSEAEAFFREKMIIAALRASGHNLCNLTEGGEGACGAKRTEETKQKLRAASTGRKHSDETKKKLADISRGKTLSQEAREKVSAAGVGRVKTRETLEKMRQAMLGRKLSEETKVKLAVAATGRKASPEAKRKMSLSRTGVARGPMPESAKQKLSAANFGKKHSAETIEKLRRVMTPERCALISEQQSKRTLSSATKAKISAASSQKKLSDDHKQSLLDGRMKNKQAVYSKVAEALRGKPKSPEHRANMSVAAKLRHAKKRNIARAAEADPVINDCAVTTLMLNQLQTDIENQPGYSQ